MLECIAEADGKSRMIWSEEAGVGFLEVDNEGVYDDDYFRNYRAMSQTPMALALNAFRVDLVWRQQPLARGAEPRRLSLLDVGIGDGAFLRAARPIAATAGIDLQGCDVNPAAIAYLIEHGQLGSLEQGGFDIVTFWDSLEHFRDPIKALLGVGRVALISIPIFADAAHALRSRHYKPAEHYWYFTRRGFIAFADQQGFDVVDVLATESALGRDGIETFVLNRRAP